MYKAFNFELTLGWPDNTSVMVKKAFNARQSNHAWGAAKRWRSNCINICGKNAAGQVTDKDSLKLIKK